MPLVLHGDDADSHRRRSFLITTMGSLVVSGSMYDSRQLLYLLDNSRATPETMATLDLWVTWGLTELQLGVYLDIDPYGNRHAAYDCGRQGLIAEGWRGILVYHKGDEKYIQRCYRTSHSAVSRNVCILCRATQEGPMVYTTHGVNALHRTTCLSTEQFITDVCGVRTYVSLPGFNINMLCYDWLHICDLTIIPEVAASALVELVSERAFGNAGTMDERLRLGFVAFTKACKRAGIRNRGKMFSMKPGFH